jgi:hypothetical protein
MRDDDEGLGCLVGGLGRVGKHGWLDFARPTASGGYDRGQKVAGSRTILRVIGEQRE